MSTSVANPDLIDGFLRYDAFPQNSSKKRGLAVPRFPDRATEVRGGNAAAVRSMAWSYDGQRVATGTELKGVRVWPVTPSSSSGRGMYANTPSPHAVTIESSSIALPSRGVSPHTGHVGTLAFSPAPDAAHILVSGCKGAKGGSVIAVWDVRSPAGPLATFKIPGDVLHLAFHPSGSHFAAVCPRSIRDEVVFFRQTETGWVQREDVMLGGLGIDVGVDEINSLRFWLAGDAVMSVSNDGSLTSWFYPTEERAPLPQPETVEEEIDERTAKKSRVEEPAAVPEAEAQPAAGEAAEGEGEGEGEGEAERDAGEEGREDEANEPTQAEAEGEGEGETGETAEDSQAAPDSAGDADDKPEITVQAPDAADGDIEMADDRADGTPAATSAPSPASRAASAPATRQPSPTPASPAPAAEPSAAESAAAEAAATERELAAKRAAAAADLAKRRHMQLAQCYRQVPHVASLLALAIDPLGRYLAVAGQDARVSLLSADDWGVRRHFDAPTTVVRHAAFSPDGELLAVAGEDAAIFIFGVVSGNTVARLPVQGHVQALAWSPVRNALAYATLPKTPVVWHYIYQE